MLNVLLEDPDLAAWQYWDVSSWNSEGLNRWATTSLMILLIQQAYSINLHYTKEGLCSPKNA